MLTAIECASTAGPNASVRHRLEVVLRNTGVGRVMIFAKGDVRREAPRGAYDACVVLEVQKSTCMQHEYDAIGFVSVAAIRVSRHATLSNRSARRCVLDDARRLQGTSSSIRVSRRVTYVTCVLGRRHRASPYRISGHPALYRKVESVPRKSRGLRRPSIREPCRTCKLTQS